MGCRVSCRPVWPSAALSPFRLAVLVAAPAPSPRYPALSPRRPARENLILRNSQNSPPEINMHPLNYEYALFCGRHETRRTRKSPSRIAGAEP